MDKQDRVSKRRTDMPARYRLLYDRCVSGKASPREAIKMQCLECWGWIQSETAKCDCTTCPLFAYRPYQKTAKQPTERFCESNETELMAEGS